ncbi:hypothetical protein [Enterococcus lemanii]|uniref:NTF2 fold domain-containing protein n=1 Tax=Enterococcus lemanii TaxID=1159752 RepID=A0ABV9MYE3_9ENTE|nr:hypothetical protein [Enterococcus lemanii]MBM7709507.1 nitrogen fixation/metabolism regulation signal transduction histidine kinase [Enterococcus lemanii]
MSRESLKSNVIKVIDNVAQESLSKKYYDTFLSNVTAEAMPLVTNGILVKNNKGNEYLIYTLPFSDVVVVETFFLGSFSFSNKFVFKDNKWLIVR